MIKKIPKTPRPYDWESEEYNDKYKDYHSEFVWERSDLAREEQMYDDLEELGGEG